MTAPPIQLSRRRFLAGTLAAGAGLLVPRRLRAEPITVDANRFALVSDIHLSADRKRVAREVNLVEHFLRVREEILALRPRPAAVIVCGDCAFNDGLPADYAVLRELTEPFRQARLPLHLLMGNHDRRAALWEAFDLEERLAAVQQKLAYLAEAAARLGELLATRKSHRLEWIVIALIAVEIVQTLWKDVLLPRLLP